jgi:hypothetical protein
MNQSKSTPNEPWAAWAESFQKMMNSPANLNPFATIPGMGGFAGMQAGGGLPGGDVASLMKSIDPAEIDRRINDMRAVESWMRLSLSTIEMSIKTMEMQRDAYASLGKMRESAEQTTHAAQAAMSRTMGAAVKAAKRAAPSSAPAQKKRASASDTRKRTR